ncbi:ATP-binding protein [Parabacteroides distasonis]|uniref:ATP-binding protein n=1 Tax=Parabacteroides distasonis TaxID=823 RepID=UPI001898ABEA|nr:ATP-binding protein [Parabacteroides distasonis]MDB8996781.1 ATP-binding protein [Parabacteroides distasonis]MDB9070256.1 ATP-binding protein [Parabacteroides distasonis]
MVNLNLYLKIIGSVSLIVLFALLGSMLLITATSYFLSFVCLCFILLITLLIIRWINGTNRKIAIFFESIRNGDAALRYPDTMNDPFVKDLYAEMNRIILLFSQNQNEMEEKRLYYESILRVLTHEIRNSITPIRSLSADLLKYSDTYTLEQLREGLEVIHGQAKNLSAFLDSYHRLTHLPEPERTEVPITSLFRKMERLLCAEAGSDRIRFSSAADLTVHADQNLIVLALINLIRNALQAIEGQVDGIVSVEALETDGRVYITITDNGPGISPELLSAIFTPFFSTKSGGSGIGLSISHRIMRLHGGDLTVNSLPGVHTEFRMKL